MSIVVEHEKRRREIFEGALDIFVEEGFDNVTYQKIADRCGITRTTLYIYFKNKREIFNFSIKQLLQDVEADIAKVRNEKNFSHTEKLLGAMIVIIERLEKNQRLLTVILNYLYSISNADYDPDYRVRRRTVRLRHILANILIEGIKAGEFSKTLNIRDANEFLYSFLEAAVFRLVILRRKNADPLKEAVAQAVRSLSGEKKE
ncbi:MAG: TetR/AcrR family transcriptional regulator [Treponema sp.]|jgi:AcrR family transcriptional regulator|nr:TetR/AcrR family transcriptional regulator [Treponema sp.]